MWNKNQNYYMYISVVICVLSKRIVNILIYFRILRDEIINEDFPTVMKLVQVMEFIIQHWNLNLQIIFSFIFYFTLTFLSSELPNLQSRPPAGSLQSGWYQIAFPQTPKVGSQVNNDKSFYTKILFKSFHSLHLLYIIL